MVGTPLQFDAVLDLCANQHRRIALAVLSEQRRRLTLSDIAKTVVKYNHHEPLQAVSGEELEELRISLHHVHVPKLVEAGLVEYDLERNLVEPTGQFDQFEPHLSKILAADDDLPTPVEL